MANRHANKKLRAAVQARMAATGEGYQSARAGVLRARVGQAPPPARAELVEAQVYGRPVVLALVEVPSSSATVMWMYPRRAAAVVARHPALGRSPLFQLHWRAIVPRLGGVQ